jgi:hypothetical protein
LHGRWVNLLDGLVMTKYVNIFGHFLSYCHVILALEVHSFVMEEYGMRNGCYVGDVPGG